MSNKNKDNSFVRHATILMLAGLVVRLIGLLYRSPLRAIIGDLGNGYYGYAYNVYSILLLVSSYSIPMAISKLMSERMALKQYRNAMKLFKGAFIYACIVGGLACLCAFVFGRQLLPQGGESALLALRILSPTIFLCAILGVMRGFFQAHQTMVPTSISQILEQLINAIVSVGAAWFFTRWFAGGDSESIAVYGAAGGTLGTGAGVLAAILFMLLAFWVNRKSIKQRLAADKSGVEDSYREIFRVILMMVTPVIFATCIYNLSAFLDQTIFAPLMLYKGYTPEEINISYGIFSGEYMVMINIPIALASAASTAVLPGVSACFALEDMEGAREKITEAMQMTMFLCIPAAVGMGVLADPIMNLLFPGSEALAGRLLICGAVSVIFYSLSTITNGVLQGIGKPSIPLNHATGALILNVVVLAVLTLFTPLGIYSVLIATIVYSLAMCIMNGLSVRKHLGFSMNVRQIFLVPGLASLIMGAVAYGVYRLLYLLIGSSSIAVLPAILAGMVVYGVGYLYFARIPREVLRRFPGGRILVKVAAILKLVK